MEIRIDNTSNVCEKCSGFILVYGDDPNILSELCKCGLYYKHGWICPKCLEPVRGDKDVSSCGATRDDITKRINFVEDFLTEFKKEEIVVGYKSPKLGITDRFINFFTGK